MSLSCTDALGNELKEGMMVRLDLDKPMVMAHLVKINDGGIINPNDKGGMIMPARFTFLAEITCMAKPGASIINCMVVKMPKEKAPASAEALPSSVS